MTDDRTDLRQTPLFQEIHAAFERSYRPGSGAIVSADELRVSPDGRHIAFAGATMEKLEGLPATRICCMGLEDGLIRVLTFGPNTDRAPQWIEGGRRIAFLSDRKSGGNFQLHFLDPDTGESSPGPAVDGWIEYMHVSPSGTALLLGVADLGAELAGSQGSARGATNAASEAWMPRVEPGDAGGARRSLWLADVETGAARKLSPEHLNVWEASWCGEHTVTAVASHGGSEADWYTATLELIDTATGETRTLYEPEDQLGWLAGSPDGQHVAVVAAVCSDRWIVAGDLLVVDTRSKATRVIATRGVDVTDIHWLSTNRLLFAGYRSFETVVGRYDLEADAVTETLTSADYTWGDPRLPRIAPIPGSDAWIAVRESFTEPQNLIRVRGDDVQDLHSFQSSADSCLPAGTRVEPIQWLAPDGLEIHGWLVRPTGEGPFPLVMDVHGGPVWQWRHRFLGRGGHHRALLERGCAWFFPNPRGSSGRGQDYARQVFGDMGGADTHDYLSGLDYLTKEGIADPDRIGVTGGSYGGFMTNWLITQDQRFAAAVAVASISNWVSEHLVCNIPHFCEQFLADEYTNLSGKYYSRSPIYFADRVRTPCLSIAGLLDRCTPANQDQEFHQALRLNGVEAALVIYPLEGHGVRRFPAVIDYSARLTGWFIEHLGLEASDA